MHYIIRNSELKEKCLQDISQLNLKYVWDVHIKLYRKKRTHPQNDFLHAVPLRIISNHTGIDIEELKTYLLGEAFGWEDVEVLDKTITRPTRRSSELNTREFTWFLEWIEAWAAQELGLIIPRPNEHISEENPQ